MPEIEMWVFSVESGIGSDPLGGSIGKVDEATYEESAHGLVVDTGPWIFGKSCQPVSSIASTPTRNGST